MIIVSNALALHQDGRTALHAAVEADSMQLAQLLLAKKAPVNALTREVQWASADVWRALTAIVCRRLAGPIPAVVSGEGRSQLDGGAARRSGRRRQRCGTRLKSARQTHCAVASHTAGRHSVQPADTARSTGITHSDAGLRHGAHATRVRSSRRCSRHLGGSFRGVCAMQSYGVVGGHGPASGAAKLRTSKLNVE